MAIVIELDIHKFIAAFEKAGLPTVFTYEGFKALFKYLDAMSIYENQDYLLNVEQLSEDYKESTIKEALKACKLEDIGELYDETKVLEVSEDKVIYEKY